MWTHIQTRDLFRQIAEKHLQIRSMGIGDYPEIGNDKLLLFVDSANEQKIVYPMLWIVPLSADVDNKETSVKYDVILMDVVQLENSNLQEVLSDTLLIIQDVYALLDTPALWDNFIVNRTISLKPFQEEYDDQVAGWSAEMSLRTSNLRDRCAVPLSEALSVPQVTYPT